VKGILSQNKEGQISGSTKGEIMIKVTNLGGDQVHISPHQVEMIEENPDTVLVMLSGRKIIVRESAEEVVDKMIEYWKTVGSKATVIKETQSSEGS